VHTITITFPEGADYEQAKGNQTSMRSM